MKYMQFWEEKVLERREGMKDGEKIGKALMLISQIRKKQQKGLGAEAIADALEEDTAYVERILQVLTKHPELTDEEIAQRPGCTR